jgi:hypothetical protein
MKSGSGLFAGFVLVHAATALERALGEVGGAVRECELEAAGEAQTRIGTRLAESADDVAYRLDEIRLQSVLAARKRFEACSKSSITSSAGRVIASPCSSFFCCSQGLRGAP